MTEKLNVTMKFEAKNEDGGPFADMTINYYGMGRSVFAALEAELMGMFKGLAQTQVEASEVKIPNPGVLR